METGASRHFPESERHSIASMKNGKGNIIIRHPNMEVQGMRCYYYKL